MVLADLGADVLRVARPAAAPIVPDARRPAGGDGDGNPYDVLHRSRPVVGVDLRNPAGADLVRRLAGRADVFLEGFRPGVAERLGLGPEELTARHPGLVYGRMTGWGRDGPLSARAGHDLTYLAVAGVLAHVGRAGQPPTPPLNLVADFGGGGMLLAVGVLAALLERGRSGRGQVVDAAMVDGAALLMAPLFGAWASGFWSAERGTNLLDSGAPFYDCYRCADGRWMAVAAIEAPFFAALLEGLGLADDPSVPDQHDRDRWPELRARLAEAFATLPRDDWVARFADRDACVAPVLTMGEAPAHPHAVARTAFADVGGVAQPAPAPRFSRTPPGPPRAAPEPGDPAAALGPWGVDAEEVRALVAAGTVT
jgi:alpha-methylacyl-CoA racemase